jgi:hypothetical protein
MGVAKTSSGLVAVWSRGEPRSYPQTLPLTIRVGSSACAPFNSQRSCPPSSVSSVTVGSNLRQGGGSEPLLTSPAPRVGSTQNDSDARPAAQPHLKRRRHATNQRSLEVEDDHDERAPMMLGIRRALIVPSADTATGRQAPPTLPKRIEREPSNQVGARARAGAAIVPARTAGAHELHAQVRAQGHIEPSARMNGLRIGPEIVDAGLQTRRRALDRPLRACRRRGRERSQAEKECANATFLVLARPPPPRRRRRSTISRRSRRARAAAR